MEDRADYFEAALRTARLADGQPPDLLPASSHLLALTHKA
ncbi:hypothetical protein ABH926_005326 [Catenulispora sp. GP43]